MIFTFIRLRWRSGWLLRLILRLLLLKCDLLAAAWTDARRLRGRRRWYSGYGEALGQIRRLSIAIFIMCMIYGSYNGVVNFVEPMVTLATLQAGTTINIPYAQPQYVC
ncbi:MAG: hypothetical protein WKF59_21510 [Chitinophagaceae bacterium]